MLDKRIIYSKDFIFDWFIFKGQRENDGELDKGLGLFETGFFFIVEWINKYLEVEKFIKFFYVYLSIVFGGMSELSYIMLIKV